MFLFSSVLQIPSFPALHYPSLYLKQNNGSFKSHSFLYYINTQAYHSLTHSLTHPITVRPSVRRPPVRPPSVVIIQWSLSLKQKNYAKGKRHLVKVKLNGWRGIRMVVEKGAELEKHGYKPQLQVFYVFQDYLLWLPTCIIALKDWLVGKLMAVFWKQYI